MKVLTLCMFAVVILAGCEAPPGAGGQAMASTSENLSEVFAGRQAARTTHDPDAVPTHLNSPRAAAQEIATRAATIKPAAQRHVELHAALYRAAIRSDQRTRGAYLLYPVDGEPASNAPAISGREFRLRVLSSFSGMSTPVAWDAQELTWMFDDRAPGGPAALAWFEIIRINEALATIEADVCLESPDIGTRKLRVEATYDGEGWNVRDLGARTVW